MKLWNNLIKFKLNYYQKLKWNIVISIVLVVTIPLPIVAGTLYNYYRTYVRSTVVSNLKGVVAKRCAAIELFLDERVAFLKTLSQTKDIRESGMQENLEYIFSIVKPQYGSFVDMGLINQDGVQSAYVGPYPLLGKDYRETTWFQEVQKKGWYISDIFLGYRKVPHLAIAVEIAKGASPRYLRATINTNTFQKLLQSAQMGTPRDAYIVNRKRELQILQVYAGNREVIDPESIAFPEQKDILISEARSIHGQKILTASTWLNQDRWVLVVAEDPTSEFISLLHARQVALILFAIIIISMGPLSYYGAQWIVRKIQQADIEKDMVQEQLMQTNKLVSLGKMAAGLAHEINNPLAVINESANYAKEIMHVMPGDRDAPSESRQKELDTALDDIIEEAFKAKDITQRLLGFARKVEAKIEDVDINRLLSDLLKYYGRVISKTRNVRIIEGLDPGVGTIRTDPSQLQQVIMNLIDNAIYFTSKEGGEVRLVTEKQDSSVKISVSDNGPGLKPGVKQRIFDPFFTTKPVGQGTGLGLAICYGIVKKLGGDIFVESEEDKGAVFTVQLPLNPHKEEDQR
jgi:two-component system NtrC family sensor kinase